MFPKLIILSLLGVLLSACASKTQPGCNQVSCRPQSDAQKMTIWWQPELRNGLYDFTQVSVNQ